MIHHHHHESVNALLSKNASSQRMLTTNSETRTLGVKSLDKNLNMAQYCTLALRVLCRHSLDFTISNLVISMVVN
jgi:hypothetical protein